MNSIQNSTDPNQLWVVMPVYNEEECLTRVVDEWILPLRRVAGAFKMCILNDGSKDGTLAILRELEKQYPEIIVIDKKNSGHGQSCQEGYRLALSKGAEWVLQIDSDGQCDPRFFEFFWKARGNNKVIYGFRNRREDGKRRYVISRFVSLFTLLGIGVWVRDANVPYRLMHRSTLEGIVDEIPRDFHLSNIMLSALQEKKFGLHWVNIIFRERMGGVPSVKTYSFVKQGFKLLRQLKKASRSSTMTELRTIA